MFLYHVVYRRSINARMANKVLHIVHANKTEKFSFRIPIRAMYVQVCIQGSSSTDEYPKLQPIVANLLLFQQGKAPKIPCRTVEKSER